MEYNYTMSYNEYFVERAWKTKELARQLSVSIATINRWIKSQKIRSVKLGKLRRIPYEEALRLTREGLAEAPKEEVNPWTETKRLLSNALGRPEI